MSGDVFVDTNVLVYAYDADAGVRHEQAKELLARLWQAKPLPWISVQVLQELLVTLRRKGVASSEARETVEDQMRWRVVENSVGVFKAAMSEMERWQLSLWDGLILASARSVGVSTVYSEDLSDEQDYGGIHIVNPFRMP
ncbi:MAG: PIN domain-containing protein [Kiritimatiellia bacterium]|jgi:predicted nucleic acid-binding protein|nr:PIN domain-containing protein [Kiritimatiellia bacterium]MDP7024078.1 PIN domain-containing protein [Kiritimatiellia bacterium]